MTRNWGAESSGKSRRSRLSASHKHGASPGMLHPPLSGYRATGCTVTYCVSESCCYFHSFCLCKRISLPFTKVTKFPSSMNVTFCFCLLLFSSCVPLFVTPWTVAHQAPLSMGFPRQDYWRGWLFHSPVDLPGPGIESASPAPAGKFFTTGPPGKPISVGK